jgi:hypothetical protein
MSRHTGVRRLLELDRLNLSSVTVSGSSASSSAMNASASLRSMKNSTTLSVSELMTP